MPNFPLTVLLCLFHTSLTIAQTYSDCITAFPLCDKSNLHFNVNEGIGLVADAQLVPCFMNGENLGQAEENSTWIYIKIKDAGQLTYVITPDTDTDDFDFVLFQLPDNGDCDQKKIVRCMAAGDGYNFSKSPCMGKTGLAKAEKDTSEDAGCLDFKDNNWLKPLDALAGEMYLLLISNITAPRGFTISFKGSALLEPCVPVEGKN